MFHHARWMQLGALAALLWLSTAACALQHQGAERGRVRLAAESPSRMAAARRAGEPVAAQALLASASRGAASDGLLLQDAAVPPSVWPRQAGGRWLPPGFSGEANAGGASSARTLAAGPKGVVFVSAPARKQVYALIDTNADHRVDGLQVVASGLDALGDIAYRDGALYIADGSRLVRVDRVASLLDARTRIEIDHFATRQHPGWRYLRVDPDGWVYLPLGAHRFLAGDGGEALHIS